MALLPMLRKASVLAALLTLSAAPAAGKRDIARLQAKMDFFRSMQEVTRSERREELRSLAQDRMNRRVLSKAVPMPSAAKDDVPDFLKVDTSALGAPPPPPSRSARRTAPQRRLEDNGEEEEENDEVWENFGFDPSEFSIKYTSCSAIAMYSDEMAEDEEAGSVFETQKFVVFRLCPSAYCNDDSSNGCGSNYGEYLIPLDDYLESYSKFKEELFEAYCEYCEQCMYFENYFYGHRELDDAGGDDVVEGDDAVGDDAVGDDAAAEEDEQHACKYYEECKDYLYSCDYDQWLEENGYNNDDQNGNNNGNNNNNDEEVDFQEYFECSEFEGYNGNTVYYVGPMCGDDNLIQFGLFSDEYCTVYIGDSVDISEFTGIDFTSEKASLEFYSSKDCISCHQSDIPYMIVRGDQEDDDEISELCEELYMASAKCNQKLWQAEDGSYVSYNQQQNEQLVCSFIENVINKVYDDEGYIVIDEDEYDQTKLFSAEEIAKASTGQILGVFFVAVGCVALIVWSCFLHRALQQQSKLSLLPPEQEFARQESGVMVGRSMSREFPENPENDHVLT